MQLRQLGIRFLLIFILAFTISLPFSFSILPNTGELMKDWVEGIGNIFTNSHTEILYSDSKIMLIWVGILILFSFTIALIWTIIYPKKVAQLYYFLNRLSTYYLALILIIYGLNKVFKYQFYFPNPNILYTPLGQLSPDILYWSSMGTSYSYSVFAGIIEIVPALLLCFRKTRMLGAFIALAVLINVSFINWGFDITVKTYTSFLILLNLIVIAPYAKRLSALFISNSTVQAHVEIEEPKGVFYKRFYPYLKGGIIVLIILEGLMPYLKSGHYNGDNQPKPKMFGAYSVQTNPESIKNIFFHSDPYIIIETNEDEFYDYKLEWQGDALILTDYEDHQSHLWREMVTPTNYILYGDFYGNNVEWNLNKLDLDSLPIKIGY